ncbi:hypothetical protein BC833DRAFT_584802 [Globomyces pollinis-pini]|nr:hypothetical protein BC833DRAFT_584802 [Globomyces pollinis-pini]
MVWKFVSQSKNPVAVALRNWFWIPFISQSNSAPGKYISLAEEKRITETKKKVTLIFLVLSYSFICRWVSFDFLLVILVCSCTLSLYVYQHFYDVLNNLKALQSKMALDLMSKKVGERLLHTLKSNKTK